MRSGGCIVGTCSICGGPVTVPETWMGIYQPIPKCESCGAIEKQPFGPVIPMEPNPKGDIDKSQEQQHPWQQWTQRSRPGLGI